MGPGRTGGCLGGISYYTLYIVTSSVSIRRRSFSPQFQNLCSVSLGRLKVAEDNNSVSVNKTSKPYIT